MSQPRSACTAAPTMSAGVMMAKVIWYSAHSASGMVSHTEAGA
jgi:hypothetical protein